MSKACLNDMSIKARRDKNTRDAVAQIMHAETPGDSHDRFARGFECDVDRFVPNDAPDVIAGMSAPAVLRQLEQRENDGARP